METATLPKPAHAHSAPLPTHCVNCGTERIGAYCHACGQHFIEEGRLTVRGVWRETVARFFLFERGLLHTAWKMCWRPGRVIAAYVRGQRRQFTNPFAYLFFATALALIVMAFYADEMQVWMTETMQAQAAQFQNPIYTEAQAQRMAELSLKMTSYSAYLYVVICIPFAVIARFFFHNSGRNVAEIFVFALFATGQTMLVDAVLDLPLLFADTVDLYMQLWKSYALFGIIFGWAAYDFFPGKWKAVFKVVAAWVIAYLGFALVQSILLAIYVFATA